MVLQFLKNAGEEGVMRDGIYDYLKEALPQYKTKEQQLRFVGRLLVEMSEEELLKRKGLKWSVR